MHLANDREVTARAIRGESHQKKCSERVRLELQQETVGRLKKGGVEEEGEGVTCHHLFSKIQFNACGVKQAKHA